MPRRLVLLMAFLALLACALCISVCAYSLLIADWNRSFLRHGDRWEFNIRSGIFVVGNQPQLNSEWEQYVADTDPMQRQWQADHSALMTEMEHAKYGKEYDAAVAKVDAWKKIHGIRYLWVPPTKLIEYHVPLLLVICLLALLPAGAIIFRRRPAAVQTPPRRPWISIAICALMTIAIGTVLGWSYHRPITFFVYGQYTAYMIEMQDGRLVVNYPAAWRSPWLRDQARFSRLLRNDDVRWSVYWFAPPAPNPFGPIRPTPAPYVIYAGMPDTRTAKWDTDVHHAEAIALLLRTMHDPDRYLAAHLMLADIMLGRVGGTRGQLGNLGIPFPAGRSILQLAQPPPRAPIATLTPLQESPAIPGQMATIAAARHKAFDARTSPVQIGLALLLLTPFAPYWLLLRRRARRWRWKTHCRNCDYNLTANSTGICPECGTPVVKTTDESLSPAHSRSL